MRNSTIRCPSLRTSRQPRNGLFDTDSFASGREGRAAFALIDGVSLLSVNVDHGIRQCGRPFDWQPEPKGTFELGRYTANARVSDAISHAFAAGAADTPRWSPLLARWRNGKQSGTIFQPCQLL